ncbi:YjeF family domain-containing protein, variant [Aphanomyces invadans]|uniref:NAD(P)H-hydrate epimerase n=1 Tax=Aphanomyces invadans TaxID=157072 RepID=A0A024UA19_9STRA|nr:YjeF family domain-containing protein, variant [Aphanomyces invadans]ETW03124.1 YjeF family domain-containing protein, variant [Aphanomyces invadans]|eukprot:XP_008868508.1 YjeF family domain-containing protein, variant [Aphanomyces invadans]
MAAPRVLLRYLNQAQAQRIDEELMSTYAFSIDQLMEMAGLSVACVVENQYAHVASSPLLVIAGPGNNGGDALVAARHLKHFGFQPEVLYPKPTPNPLYQRLAQQCQDMHIPFVQSIDTPSDLSRYSLVVDGIFGFSFRAPPRAPFDKILSLLACSSTPIVSIDIPSGWDVELGDQGGNGVRPAALVSLTAPKQCAQHFHGLHFVGGRFVPPALAAAYHLATPPYVGSQQFAPWPHDPRGATTAVHGDTT